MLLSEYDIQYVTQKVIKGSVLSEYLAYQPLEDYHPMRFEFHGEDFIFVKDYEIRSPDEGPKPGAQWKLAFNGESNAIGNGIGAVLISA